MVILAQFARPDSSLANILSQFTLSPGAPAWNWTLPLCAIQPNQSDTEETLYELLELHDVREAIHRAKVMPTLAIHGPISVGPETRACALSAFGPWLEFTRTFEAQLREASRMLAKKGGITYRLHGFPNLLLEPELAEDGDRNRPRLIGLDETMPPLHLKLKEVEIVRAASASNVAAA